ncbi:MAG: hypothetical protein L3J56_06350 [Bacteroidales bacterium]|nr:hypothetical protein [Bacteroidales bacterium]
MCKLTEQELDYIVDKVLQKMKIKENELQPQESEIINNICNYTGISYNEVKSKSRKQKLVRARYIIFAELVRKLNYSLSKAGAVLGYDHSTVHFAISKLNGGEYQMTKFYKEYLNSKK